MSEIKTFQYFNERIYVYESRRIRRKRYYTLNCLFQIARLWHELFFLSRNMYAAPLNRRNKIHVTKPRYSSVKCNTPILKCAHRTLSNPYLSRTLPYYYIKQPNKSCPVIRWWFPTNNSPYKHVFFNVFHNSIFGSVSWCKNNTRVTQNLQQAKKNLNFWDFGSIHG